MNACSKCRGSGEVESAAGGPGACPQCGGNGEAEPRRPRRVCLFGSRVGVPSRSICEAIDGLPSGTEVVVGGDQAEDREIAGTDALVAVLARRRGLRVTLFRADWKKHGKPAGPIRNGQMAEYADEAIGFRKAGKSNGTDDCERKFKALGKPVRFAWKEEWDAEDAPREMLGPPEEMGL